MSRLAVIYIIAMGALAAGGCATETARRDPGVAAEARAVEFLKREVPAWSRDNGCFSCHNNGDAARALYKASRKGHRIPQSTLADTTEWVAHPYRWAHNKGDSGFSDQRLADVQFAATLAVAVESGAVKNPQALEAAALKVALAQAEDGSWPIDVANPAGSPATYGLALSTYMAWDSLRHVTSPQASDAREKAEKRLRAINPDSVPNAVVLLLFLANYHESSTAAATPSKLRRRRGDEAQTERSLETPHVVSYGLIKDMTQAIKPSLDFLRRAQTSDGGWGPYADSPPEAFDTALALLALAEVRTEEAVPEMVQHGREFLIAMQLPDGSWPATTRPSGGQSYAQQISTTAWATLALLATR